MNKMLTNKTCIIVGASGEIGLNCSQLFYDQGARLILIYNKNFKVIKQFNKDKKNIYTFKCNLSKENKAYMKWDGKWKPWPMSERNALKQRIILALKMFDNNRTHAAKHLRMSVRYLYKLMHDKFIEVNWTKQFPPPIVSIVDQKTDHKKRNQSIKNSWVRRSKQLQKLRGPKILELHHKGYNLTSIHRELGHSKKFIKKVIENESRK